MQDLREGRWRAALDELLDAPEPSQRPRTDGAAVVADEICGLISRS
jgi:hypothetical protein